MVRRSGWSVASDAPGGSAVGTQGSVTDEFTDQVTTATISYLDTSEAETA